MLVAFWFAPRSSETNIGMRKKEALQPWKFTVSPLVVTGGFSVWIAPLISVKPLWTFAWIHRHVNSNVCGNAYVCISAFPFFPRPRATLLHASLRLWCLTPPPQKTAWLYRRGDCEIQSTALSGFRSGFARFFESKLNFSRSVFSFL